MLFCGDIILRARKKRTDETEKLMGEMLEEGTAGEEGGERRRLKWVGRRRIWERGSWNKEGKNIWKILEKENRGMVAMNVRPQEIWT